MLISANPMVSIIRGSITCLFLIASPIFAISQDAVVGSDPAATTAVDTDSATNADAEKDSEAAVAPQPEAAQTTVSQPDGLKFNFAGASWSEVLKWFAEQADLSLQIDATPAGTVNFSDPEKTYSVTEGLDLLNRLLLDRGWAVVRRGRMLLLVDLEADNAEKLISEMAELVTPDDFERRGESDIVRCVFPLGGISPEQAREELGQIIGPWGRVSVLAGARQVVVTETVGKLKVIGQVLATASEAQSSVIQIALQHRAAEEVMEIARPLLELEPGTNSNDQIRISVSIYGDQLFATGDPSKLDLLSSIVTRADTAPPGADDGEDVEQAAAVLKTHLIEVAELQSVFDVLQTLLAGQPEVRLAIDQNRQAIVALARPTTQIQIESAIQELEGSGKDFEIINLKRLEPANALLTINKFFGVTEADSGNGPKVDGDPETGRLWVRGTSQQIETVKRLISELENDPLAGGLGDNVRILPFSGDTAIETMRQIESLWPLTGRRNRIRLIVPSDESKQESPGERADSGNEANAQGFLDRQSARPLADANRQTLVWQNGPTNPGSDRSAAQPQDARETETTFDSEPDYTGDDIVIQLTPAGLVIASRDPIALDLVEQLINSLGTPGTGSNDLPTLFWLKYLKADVASEIVASVLGGADTGGSAGSMAESMMGGLGGGMLGGLLGMGGGGGEESSTLTILTSRGSVNIVPDNRLNALIVQAPPADIEFIRTVLTEIDREESPETIQTIARPQLIPVIYQEAAQVAEIVKSVFGEKTGQQQESGRGGGQTRPEDLIAALRGGGGRGGGGGGEAAPKSEASKIIVAVDERSNSLVVTATPQDFQAVRDLVETLDQQGMEAEQSVEVIAMGGTVKPEIMQQALETILGKKTSSTGSSSSNASGTGSDSSSTGTPSGSSPEDIQRRIESFRSRFGGGGAPGGGGGGRGDTGRGGGGPGGGGAGGGGGRGGRGR